MFTYRRLFPSLLAGASEQFRRKTTGWRLLIRGVVFVSFLPASALAVPVTVRILDQDTVEHTLGQICASGVGCTVSGGTLDLTVGATHTFTLIPSAANSRTGEQAFNSGALSRADVVMVPGLSLDFLWQRAPLNPIDLQDQDGVSHTLGRFNASAAWSALVGDVVRLPVTTDPGLSGMHAAGYQVTTRPSAANDRLGEQAFASARLARLETRPVDATDDGVFVWQRATWVPLNLVDQDAVPHSKGLLVANGAWVGVPGDTMRVPVTTDPGLSGMHAAGYQVTTRPSAANDRLGEQAFGSARLARLETRPVDATDDGVFVWQRATWVPLNLVDQDAVPHSKGLLVANGAWVGVPGDTMRVPVTTDPGLSGMHAAGYQVTTRPSAANDRLGEQAFGSARLARLETRPVDVTDDGVFVWQRATWVPLNLVDQDAVPHSKGLLVANGAWVGVPGDTMRVPVTTDPGLSGMHAAGYQVTTRPSAANDRLGEQAFGSARLARLETRPVDVTDDGVFVWQRATWVPLNLVDQDAVPHSKGLLVANGAWVGVPGDTMRVPVTTDPGLSGMHAAGYQVTTRPSAANDRLGEQAFGSARLARLETRPVDVTDDGVFRWDRAVCALQVIRNDVDPVPGTSMNANGAWSAVADDKVRLPVTEGGAISGSHEPGYDITGTTGDTSSPYSVDDVEVVTEGFQDPAIFFLGATKYELQCITGCPDPETIDYQGFTASQCDVPQNTITVFNQAELDAYLADFGFDGSTVKNLNVGFNPTGDVVIVSPCEVNLAGENGSLDVEARQVCVYGRKGVSVAQDASNPDRGITAGAVALISEEGSAVFSEGR